MKIKPSTLALLLAALAMGGIALLVQQQPAPKSTETEAGQPAPEESSPLFSFQEADIQTLTLKTQLRTLKFERDKDSKWQMLEPEKTTASDPSLAFLLDLVTSGTSSRTLTAPASDREQFGLHQPLATLDLTLKDKQTHKLVIGGYDFNRAHLYAQVDPPADPPASPPAEAAEPLKVLLVSPNFDQAVNRPLAEWKQSATAEKAAPSGSPTPAPSPDSSPEASSESPVVSPAVESTPEASSSPENSPKNSDQ